MPRSGSRPLFGLTVGAEDAAARVVSFGADFCDLHFGDRVQSLLPALAACDTEGIQYMLNFEGAPIGWKPPSDLKSELARRPGFLGFVLDEADHMQINAHWPVVDYYGYNDAHYLAETEGLDLFAARQAVLDALRQRARHLLTGVRDGGGYWVGADAAVESLREIIRLIREWRAEEETRR